MSKVSKIVETPTIWILTMRGKKTKQLYNVVFHNSDLVKSYIDTTMKEWNCTFITLTNRDRLLEYNEGTIGKEFSINLKALQTRKVDVDVRLLYADVLIYIESNLCSEGYKVIPYT